MSQIGEFAVQLATLMRLSSLITATSKGGSTPDAAAHATVTRTTSTVTPIRILQSIGGRTVRLEEGDEGR